MKKVFVISFFLFLAGTLFGQGYKASIVGRITDPAGTAVPNATVAATNIGTNIAISTVSNAEGNYVIPQLVPGDYRVSAQAKGFKAFVRERVTLEVDQAARVDIPLEVGAITEQVTVRDEAPTVDTENSTLGQVVNTHEITDIPLNGRNYIALALLSPGVVPSAGGANPDNINGSRSDHVNYLVDGVSNINKRGNEGVATPSIDAIQEYKIITNNFSAEYGRLGGGVISVALQSGTNHFHGALFDFLRNDALDARGFFDPQVPNLRRNQFGAVLDGPIIKDKTFFLFSYEGTRIRQQVTSISRVPTLAERGGVFSTPVIDPQTGKPFPTNTIPSGRISPIATNILPYMPLPNLPGAFNFISTEGAPQNSDAYIVKIDHYLRPADQLSVKWLYNGANLSNPYRSTSIPGYGSNRNTARQDWSASEVHTFSPSLINEFRAGYTRDSFLEQSVNAGKNTSAQVGITGVAPGFGLTNIVLAGYPGSFGDAIFLPDIWTDNEYAISDVASRNAGNHSIRFGADYQRSQQFNAYDAFGGGQMGFLGLYTGNPFAEFLLGLPTQTERQVGTSKDYMFSNYFGVFLQDDWKVRPNLTLNLGVRYDISQPPAEKYNRWANFDPALGKSIVAGTPGYPRALMDTHYRNFSPRLGLAWRVTPKTVVRGGYGIFYGFDLQYTMYQILGATAYPFTQIQLYQAPRPGLLTLADPFPSTFPGAAPGASSPNGWDMENPPEYMQDWNITVSRELSQTLGLDISYVGTKGTHQSQASNLNQWIRTPTGNIVPYPGLSQVLYENLGANSIYNALQISLRKRFSNGISFRSNFSWSKSIDDASFGTVQPQNSRDLAAERGLSSFNRAYVWSNDLVYALPFGRGHRFGAHMSRAEDLLLGGWQVNGLMQVYSGLPFTPTVSKSNIQQGFATRPDRLGSGTVPNPTINGWFDPTAFAVVPPTAYRFGNSGRDILTGPGAVGLDGSLFKEFAMPGEGHTLQFRAEFFNVMNHPNFGLPAAAIDQPTAGLIRSAGPGREIQFALKFLF